MSYKLIPAASVALRLEVLNLLFENNLPVTDLDEKKNLFALLDKENKIVGTGGLEYYNDVALLRSISVKKELQGKGWGKQISRDLEQIAKQHAVQHLFLLTTTAKDFFEKEGYHIVDRNEVPLTIQKTTEFAGVCPSSATVMKKQLSL